VTSIDTREVKWRGERFAGLRIEGDRNGADTSSQRLVSFEE
jgi:hypothetical protein